MTTKVRRPSGADGGDKLEVLSGGEIEVKTGGEIKIGNEELTALVTLIAAIPDEDQEDSVTIWNDDGVLKVSGAG